MEYTEFSVQIKQFSKRILWMNIDHNLHAAFHLEVHIQFYVVSLHSVSNKDND